MFLEACSHETMFTSQMACLSRSLSPCCGNRRLCQGRRDCVGCCPRTARFSEPLKGSPICQVHRGCFYPLGLFQGVLAAGMVLSSSCPVSIFVHGCLPQKRHPSCVLVLLSLTSPCAKCLETLFWRKMPILLPGFLG